MIIQQKTVLIETATKEEADELKLNPPKDVTGWVYFRSGHTRYDDSRDVFYTEFTYAPDLTEETRLIFKKIRGVLSRKVTSEGVFKHGYPNNPNEVTKSPDTTRSTQ